jgi:hypothetical protein
MSINYEQQTFRSQALQSIVEEAITFFSNTPIHLLPPSEQFSGVGVYSLYYVGSSYSWYTKLADPTFRRPIYVGKAVPAGWRAARSKAGETANLYGRLKEHGRNIGYTTDLKLSDFRCRFMILAGIESDLIAPVEAGLIRKFRPLWNTTIDGFGNHDPGSGRYNQARSEWDVLHPGRSWANRLTGQSPELETILKKIEKFLEDLLS